LRAGRGVGDAERDGEADGADEGAGTADGDGLGEDEGGIGTLASIPHHSGSSTVASRTQPEASSPPEATE